MPNDRLGSEKTLHYARADTGLKPRIFIMLVGTAEAVPSRLSIIPLHYAQLLPDTILR